VLITPSVQEALFRTSCSLPSRSLPISLPSMDFARRLELATAVRGVPLTAFRSCNCERV
jgi:hypothetical protein